MLANSCQNVLCTNRNDLESATPVYFIGLGDRARRLIGTTGPLAKIDLKRAEGQLETLARVSGGRAYLKDATSDLPGIYDDMPELNGLKATEMLTALAPDTRVLILTRHSDSSYVQQLLRSGASGYILKQSASDQLVHGDSAWRG